MSERLALFDEEGDVVGFMLGKPELRRVARTRDLRQEDKRRRKMEEERYPFPVRVHLAAHRRIMHPPLA